jgi:4-amino-4-deoxy-L-arabinose transferase-like glycosyltransferase
MTLAVPVRRGGTIGWLFLALAVGALAAAANFVGYDGADDRSYALAAEAWLNHFPAVGDDHWATRHTVVLPVAASLALLGRSVLALALPSLLFFAGLLIVNFVYARRYLGERPAAVLVLLLALTPAFVVQATYINNDIVEAFFASLAFWLFVAGADTGRRTTLVVAGVAAGLAFLTRETSAVLLVFFALCALLDRRRDYAFVALGFVLPVAAEMAFFAFMTGDPFHRYRLDAGHDTVSRMAEFQHRIASGKVLDRQGNLSLSVWADPVLVLFASQKFAALFWLAVPAAAWVWRTATVFHGPVMRRVVLLALLWIAFVSLAFPILYLVPRYYVVPAWASVMVLAFAFHRLSSIGYRKLALAGLAVLLAGNALSLYLENTTPRFAELALVRWLGAHPGTRVTVDPDMARRSDLLLRYAGEAGRVRAGVPQAGELFVFSPRNLDLCRATGGCREPAYRPRPEWEKIGAVSGRPRAIGAMLRNVGVARRFPSQIMDKIEHPAPGIVVYRVR